MAREGGGASFGLVFHQVTLVLEHPGSLCTQKVTGSHSASSFWYCDPVGVRVQRVDHDAVEVDV